MGQRAKDRVREEIDRRSTDAGSQVRSVADGLRQASTDLRKEGNPAVAKVADTAAEKIDGVASYLTSSDADALLRDLDTLATPPGASNRRRLCPRHPRGEVPQGLERALLSGARSLR